MCLHPNTELGKAPTALDCAEKESLSAAEPAPLNEVQLKDIQPIWASAGWELACLWFEGWAWTIEFGPAVQAFGIVQLCFGAKFYFKNKSGGLWVVGAGRSLLGAPEHGDEAHPSWRHHASLEGLQHYGFSQPFICVSSNMWSLYVPSSF